MRGKLADVIRIGVAVVLGGIGAAAGFTHTHDWAVSHGQTGWLAWATAVVIEGMAVVAGFEIHHDRAAGHSFKFPAAVLVFGVLVQMTAQVAEAEPSPAGWLVAAMPALGFLAVVKLLMRHTPTEPPAPAEATDAAKPAQEASTAVPRVRLPADITARIDAAVTAARDEGREPSIEDIQRVARVPADLARRVLANRPATNGHSLHD
ncbi:DUF2637 domain-containing protein [Actinophytocola algeriensis]|uniref:DUF2637 domain-containing protein n=1 Tax=Actinophytocola algeriensis TaxID=1768010 RepID=A0A7W7Q3S5_9PSEU|nr:DUF2637 domain-containing protein [Actinophytocola algeriensis]MBB4906368.1 hypothetical protein [Actinophytocola algeriensis]MBE1477849.1 hypothetical protein [Actinophytocola algeriensis]